MCNLFSCGPVPRNIFLRVGVSPRLRRLRSTRKGTFKVLLRVSLNRNHFHEPARLRFGSVRLANGARRRVRAPLKNARLRVSVRPRRKRSSMRRLLMVSLVVHIVAVQGDEGRFLGGARNPIRVSPNCHGVRANSNHVTFRHIVNRVTERRTTRRPSPCLAIQGIRHVRFNRLIMVLCHGMATLVRREGGTLRFLHEHVRVDDRDLRASPWLKKGSIRLT